MAAFVAGCSLVGFTIKNIGATTIKFKRDQKYRPRSGLSITTLLPQQSTQSGPDWGDVLAHDHPHSSGDFATSKYDFWIQEGDQQVGLNTMPVGQMRNRAGAQLLINPLTICSVHYNPHIKKVLFSLVAPDGRELIVSPEILEEKKKKLIKEGIAESPYGQYSPVAAVLEQFMLGGEERETVGEVKPDAGDAKRGEEKKKQAESPRAKPLSGAPGGPAFTPAPSRPASPISAAPAKLEKPKSPAAAVSPTPMPAVRPLSAASSAASAASEPAEYEHPLGQYHLEP